MLSFTSTSQTVCDHASSYSILADVASLTSALFHSSFLATPNVEDFIMSSALATFQPTELASADALRLPAPRPTESPHDLLQLDDIVRGLQLLRRHCWRLVFGIVIGLLAGAYYFVTVTPTYEAKAQLLIEKQRAVGIDGISAGLVYHREDAGTHIAILKSPWFIGQVIQSRGLGELSLFEESRDPIKLIQSAVIIVPEKSEEDGSSESVVLNLTFQGPVAEECKIVLNALIESYKSHLNKTSRNENEGALKLITHKAEEVRGQMNDLEAEYGEFIKASPHVIIKGRDTRYYESRIADLEVEEASLNGSRAELERRLAALKAVTEDDGDRRFAMALVPDDYKKEAFKIVEDRYRTFEEALLPLLMEERNLLRTLGPGHRKVRDVRDQIALTREMLAPSSANRRQLLTQADIDHSVRWADPIHTFTGQLKQELDDVVNLQQTVDERLERARHRLQDYTNFEYKERRSTRDRSITTAL